MGDPTPQSRLRDQLDLLGVKFLLRSGSDAARMADLLPLVRQGDAAALGRLGQSAHSLHGGGAMFGFGAISDTAAEIEHMSEKLMPGIAVTGGRLEQHAMRLLEDCIQRLAKDIVTAEKSAR